MYKFDIAISDKTNNMTFPRVDGYYVRGREEYFSNNQWNHFFYPEPIFNYMTIKSPILTEQEEWILNDVHNFAGEYPNNLLSIVVSEKMKKVIHEFKVLEIKFYDGKLKFKDILYNYFVLHTILDGWSEYVDFEKSLFTEWSNYRFKKYNKANYQIQNLKDFDSKNIQLVKESKRKYRLGPNRLILNKTIDFIYIPVIGYTISQRLKDAIEEAGITGVEITPIDNVEFVEEVS